MDRAGIRCVTGRLRRRIATSRQFPMKHPRHIICLLALSTGCAVSAEPPTEDRVQGLYEGMWKDAAASAKAEGRCVAMGDRTYKLLVRRTVDGSVQRAELDGVTDPRTGAVTFGGTVSGTAWEAGYGDGVITGTAGDQDRLELRRLERTPPSLARKPPAGAIVLLDGRSFDEMKRSGNKPWYLGPMSEHGWPIWEVPLRFSGAREPKAWPGKDNPLPEGWSILPERRQVDAVVGIDGDGSIQMPRGGMESARSFKGSFDAHVEFQCNFNPKARGQGRGNSGVYLPNGQEIQVLDSFGTGTYLGGGCGGLYKKKDPDCMEPIPSLEGKEDGSFTLASLPPLEWQTYDIEFRTTKEPDGKGKGLLTVCHNGIKIHDAVETKPATGGKWRFQDHGNSVRYRNIWVVERNGE